MTTLALILAAVAAALSVGLLTFGAAQLSVGKPPVKKRVKGLTERTLDRLGKRVAPYLPAGFRQRTEKKITMAGGLDDLTPEGLAARSVLSAILAGLIGFVLFAGAQNGWLVPVFFFAGLLLPVIRLNDQVKQRHNAMLRQLPFHLDLLTLGVEAGLDFTAALATMVEKGKPGPLREEFNLMLSQIRVGVARGQAMREMATRVDLPQLTTFLSALIQADKLGMSIGKVLRVQSEGVRVERSQRAEQRANEAPVKILIPLVIFVFPTIWIILFAPMIFSFAF